MAIDPPASYFQVRKGARRRKCEFSVWLHSRSLGRRVQSWKFNVTHRMPGQCVAYGCKNRGAHIFPRDPALRKKWIKAVRRVNFTPSPFSRLCGSHFLESDYFPPGYNTGLPPSGDTRKKLKKGVVPSLFSWKAAQTNNNTCSSKSKAENTLMNDKEFQNFKKQVLHCPDASKKGDIDEHIRGICGKINSHTRYVTLSSCSGRTAVVLQASDVKLPRKNQTAPAEFVECTYSSNDKQLIARDANSCNSEVQKEGCQWAYCCHDYVDGTDLINRIHSSLDKGDLILKFEPFILHVACQTLEDAKSMLTCALNSGCKNSGIVIGKHRRYTVAARNTLQMEVPLSSRGKLLVSEEFLVFLAAQANDKMTSNLKKLDKLTKCIDVLLSDKTENIN